MPPLLPDLSTPARQAGHPVRCLHACPAPFPLALLQSGKFYRWRLAWATPKRFATLVILGPDGRPAPCEMQLISKDGVYLMQARWGGRG